MRSYRCSSLPLYLVCPASAQAPGIDVREHHDAADVGTEAHLHLESLVQTGSVEWSSISTPEVRSLVAAGARMWKDLEQLFPHPLTEVPLRAELPGVMVTGHPDSLSVIGRTARILDWKSGRVDHDYREQLLAYAALVLLDDPELDSAETLVVWLRDGDVERHTMTREQLPTWTRRIVDIAASLERYVTGSHCEHCPRSHECPGRMAMVRRDVSAFALSDAEFCGNLATMPPERLLELVRSARMVGRAAERAVDAVRELVRSGGDIVSDDGSRLTLAPESRRAIDTAAAWDILCEVLSPEALAACVDVRISKVEDAVAKKAPPRKGAAAKRALGAALDAAGAITLKVTHRLVERRN